MWWLVQRIVMIGAVIQTVVVTCQWKAQAKVVLLTTKAAIAENGKQTLIPCMPL